MNTRIRIIPWVMLVVGFILLSAGVAELYPLCRAARNCQHTVGIVQRVETKKNYRHRKLRYDTEMTVIYSTEKYGDLSVTRTSHWPLRGREMRFQYGIIQNVQERFICLSRKECSGEVLP